MNVGGNYVTGATTVSQTEGFAGDVTFKYQITRDRRLSIRAYNRNTLTVEGRKIKSGQVSRTSVNTITFRIFGKRRKADTYYEPCSATLIRPLSYISLLGKRTSYI